MIRIRVDPSELRSAALEIAETSQGCRDLAERALRATGDASSYDGQFGPRVRAIGDEAYARLNARADRLSELSHELDRIAEDFEVADEESLISIQTMSLLMDRFAHLMPSITPAVAMVAWLVPDADLSATQRLGKIYAMKEQRSFRPLRRHTNASASSSTPSPTPTPPFPTPTPSPAQSPTEPATATPPPTPSATMPPSSTPTPSSTPSPIPIYPTNTPGTPVFDSEEFREQISEIADKFFFSFSLLREPLPIYPQTWLDPLKYDPRTAGLAEIARWVLTGSSTAWDIFRPFRDLDPTYPLNEPVPGGPSGQLDGGNDVS
ncbi:MAG: WXG100 family type VII secretion target [Anaerolineales bacterium]